MIFVVRPLMTMLVTSAPVNSPADNGPALPASVGQVEAALAAKQPAQILDMARSNPAATAVVVKQWLKSNA
jgi:flagellar M-ring protein FliF